MDVLPVDSALQSTSHLPSISSQDASQAHSSGPDENQAPHRKANASSSRFAPTSTPHPPRLNGAQANCAKQPRYQSQHFRPPNRFGSARTESQQSQPSALQNQHSSSQALSGGHSGSANAELAPHLRALEPHPLLLSEQRQSPGQKPSDPQSVLPPECDTHAGPPAPQSMASGRNLAHPEALAPAPQAPLFSEHISQARQLGPQTMFSPSPTGHPRPPPQSRKLYDPRSGERKSIHANPVQYPTAVFTGPTHAQVDFLERLALSEIAKAEMSLEELDEKENFRLALQQICRDAVTRHELERDKHFNAASVSLKCFGSLSTGFATHSSDMDLALVSPNSHPDTSSTESEIPRLLEKALLDAGYGARLLTKTRVPIIKLCEKPTPKLRAALMDERKKWEEERAKPPHTLPENLPAEPSGNLPDNPPANPPDNPPVNQTENKPDSPPDSTAHTTQHSASDSRPEILAGPPSENPPKNSSAKPLHRSPGNGRKNTAVESPTVFRTDKELVYLFKLAMKEGWYEENERELLNSFIQAVENPDPISDDATLGNARAAVQPLTELLKRYRPPPDTHLDFPRDGVGIQCDINFSNPLALHNTRLLRCYSLCDPRVRLIVIFIKAWAKRRRINDPYHGTLSSYGYVLMVLHYLANIVEPAIIPNLQQCGKALRDKSPENNLIIDGYNVRFWRSESEIRDRARRRLLTRNHEDGIGIIICGFFHYFAHRNTHSPGGGFCWAEDVLSLRTRGGLLRKKDKGWTGAKSVVKEPTVPGQETSEIKHRYLLAIEDPFETDHNIARTVVHHGIVAIRDEFRRAVSIIQSVGLNIEGVEELFAEAKVPPSMPRKAFGPRPTRDAAASKAKNTSEAKDGELITVLSKGETASQTDQITGGISRMKINHGGAGDRRKPRFMKNRQGNGSADNPSAAGPSSQPATPVLAAKAASSNSGRSAPSSQPGEHTGDQPMQP